MGNCLTINLNVSCENLLSLCCRQDVGAAGRENLMDFQNDWWRLKAARSDVMNKIKSEESQQRKPLEQVELWLSRVTKLEDPAEELIVAFAQESVNKCFYGYCHQNYVKYSELRREMVSMAQEVNDLLTHIPADVVAERKLIPPAQKIPIEPTIGMESMLDHVFGYIDQDGQGAGVIGLYGMGGVGKTTLLKQINNKLFDHQTNKFDLLLWIVVSKTPNLASIQNDIGEKVGFLSNEWRNQTQEKKARDIWNVLNKKKYVMLLDDIWARFDLIEMGLPLPTSLNKSKVIFTTRLKTLCGEMEARMIQVNCLTEKEAWELFQEKVGVETLNAHTDIPELAKEVMKECKGLPLALKVIGRAMTYKTSPESWKLTINLLKRSTAYFSGMGDEVFPLLKYSYDSLPNDSIKSCFLYCCLYPEDEEISKEELIDKWICEGFLVESDNLHEARYKGYDFISTLVNASLLEECTPEKFKMHDVIRDMAIWIGCECGDNKDKYVVRARSGLSQIPNSSENWEGAERMSLVKNDIKEITKAIHCPKLITMFLGSSNLKLITTGFFKYMPNLKVLDLSHNKEFEMLPSDIFQLASLQYLNLRNTCLERLPADFKKLTALIYLSIETTSIRQIPEGVISSCKNLQVLKLFRHYELPNPRFGFTDPELLTKALVAEIESLEYLEELTICIKTESGLAHLTSSSKLMSITSELTLFYFDGPKCLDLSFLKEMINLDKLQLAYMFKLEEIKVGKESYFNKLRYLHIYRSELLENLSWIVFAPNIEYINISKCGRMKALVGSLSDDMGELPVPFGKLKSLELLQLAEFGSIYPSNLPFPNLKNLGITKCSESFTKLPFDSSSCNGSGITIRGNGDWWNNLAWEDEATRLTFSSTFKPTR